MSIQPFLEYLEKRKTDRGLMADLRHGFSPGTEYRAWPHLARWTHGQLTDDRLRKIWTTVAAGYAVHKTTADVGNMGWTLRQIALGGQSFSEEALKRLEGRMRRFLSCRSSVDVCERLPGVIRMAERNGALINFGQLYEDLVYWGERVKVRWAASYWQSPTKTGKGGGDGADKNSD